MKRKIRPLICVLPALVIAGAFILACVGPVGAVPSFVRQTNMSCNQCHTTFSGPVPNFTMTNKKFRTTGYRMVDVREMMESEEEGALGERLKLPLIPYWSFRLQSTFVSVAKNPFTGDWGDVSTNPTSRLAIFFVGPIGDHFGVWNEWYFHVLGSETEQWSLCLASWDEYDIKYSFNPHNPDMQAGVALCNMPVYDVMGFGPFPVFAGGRQAQRSEVEGLAHPNYATAYFWAWLKDRWSILLGGNTGDNDTKWVHSNFVGGIGYAIKNTNEDELWLHSVFRVGKDVQPLVTTDYVEDRGRDWSYKDYVEGVMDTRPDSTTYLWTDIDKASTLEGEIRWSRQNWGPHSYEADFRVSWNKEEYKDGAKTDLTTLGFEMVYTYKHTYYLIPFWNTKQTFNFTDHTGYKHKIKNTSQVGGVLGFKPTENMQINFQVLNTQVLRLGQDPADEGVAISFYLDFLI
jgi:hypothetical protein